MHVPPRLTTLVAAVADIFGIAPEEVLGRSRLKSHAGARHVVVWVIRKTWIPTPSTPEIGRFFGLDHTTVLTAVKKIDSEIARGTEIGKIAMRFGPAAPVLRLMIAADDACPCPDASILAERQVV